MSPNRIQQIVSYVLCCFLYLSCSVPTMEVDILLQNGTVYNGEDTNSQAVSVGIKGDKIVYVGQETDVKIEAKKTIDAKGLVVCPGFIDPHTHADRELNVPEESHNLPFLMQGITTVVVGNDGDSFYPISKYKDLYQKQGIGTNAVLLAGHGTIRRKILGKSDRAVGEGDIEKMQIAVRKEMEAGAFGLSTGLFYAPGSYSETSEVIALAKVVAEFDGIYDTHLRDESSYTVGLIPAVKEAIEIGKAAQIPINISHIKCLGVDVWEQSDSIIQLIEENRAAGLKIMANQYPYDASATSLKAAVVPRWAESGGMDSLLIRYHTSSLKLRILEETKANITRRGGPDKLLIVKSEDSTFVGKNLAQIAEQLNVKSEVAVYEALKTGYIRVASFNMNPYDIKNYMQQDWVVPGSDGNTGHPRKYGTFPRMYHKYVKQDQIMDVGTFIKKSTMTTADILKIPNRGQLKEGYWADVIVFDPQTFKDKADYTDAFQLAEGLVYSIVNGKMAVEKGEYSKGLYGRVLEK